MVAGLLPWLGTAPFVQKQSQERIDHLKNQDNI
jgi:hypothetical protein